MFGIGALIESSVLWLTAPKWIGGAYFVWLGIQVWRSRSRPARARSGASLFRQGLLSAATNPKALPFFTASLPRLPTILGAIHSRRDDCVARPDRVNPYDRFVLPHLVNCVCGSRVIEQQRRALLPRASGRVLEIGFGSGLNLPHYDRARVETVWALEPSAPMRELAAARIAASALDVRLLDRPAEELPLPDASIDTVVVTFSLCTIADPLAALRQARRVLRPGGALLFCEHGVAPDPGVRRWQSRLDGIWSRLGGGCHLDRDVAAMLAATGFVADELHAAYLPGTPRIAGYASWGRAAADPDLQTPTDRPA